MLQPVLLLGFTSEIGGFSPISVALRHFFRRNATKRPQKAYFAMKGCTHEKWKINPSSKTGVDAAAISAPSITFWEFLKLFDRARADGAVGTGQTRFRELTIARLARITKGIEKKGYALIDVPEERSGEIRNALMKKGYSFLPIYVFSKDEEPARAPSVRFLAVFSYNCRNRTFADPDAFESDTAALTNETAGRADASPVRFGDGADDLFGAILARCRITEENPVCMIRTPPSSAQMGHMRWAAGDLNHICKEEMK